MLYFIIHRFPASWNTSLSDNDSNKNDYTLNDKIPKRYTYATNLWRTKMIYGNNSKGTVHRKSIVPNLEDVCDFDWTTRQNVVEMVKHSFYNNHIKADAAKPFTRKCKITIDKTELEIPKPYSGRMDHMIEVIKKPIKSKKNKSKDSKLKSKIKKSKSNILKSNLRSNNNTKSKSNDLKNKSIKTTIKSPNTSTTNKSIKTTSTIKTPNTKIKSNTKSTSKNDNTKKQLSLFQVIDRNNKSNLNTLNELNNSNNLNHSNISNQLSNGSDLRQLGLSSCNTMSTLIKNGELGSYRYNTCIMKFKCISMLNSLQKEYQLNELDSKYELLQNVCSQSSGHQESLFSWINHLDQWLQRNQIQNNQKRQLHINHIMERKEEYGSRLNEAIKIGNQQINDEFSRSQNAVKWFKILLSKQLYTKYNQSWSNSQKIGVRINNVFGFNNFILTVLYKYCKRILSDNELNELNTIIINGLNGFIVSSRYFVGLILSCQALIKINKEDTSSEGQINILLHRLTNLFMCSKKVMSTKWKLNSVNGCHELLQLGYEWIGLIQNGILRDVSDILTKYSQDPFFSLWRTILLRDTVKIEFITDFLSIDPLPNYQELLNCADISRYFGSKQENFQCCIKPQVILSNNQFEYVYSNQKINTMLISNSNCMLLYFLFNFSNGMK